MTDTEIEDVRLGAQSWRDIEAALDGDVDTVILPLGATEQHGPHLPVDTDTRIATELATRVAHRLGNTLVAPTLSVGPSIEHGSFEGTISVSVETINSLLSDYVGSLERQGFEYIIILPGHGGWFPAIGSVYPSLAREASADVVAFTDLRRYLELLGEGLEAAGIDVDEPVVHAGASETAMMLAIAADEVTGELPEGHTGPVSAAAVFNEGISSYAENGVLGDATPATADAGELILEHITDEYVSDIQSELKELESN